MPPAPPRPSMQALAGPGESEGFVRRTARLLYDDCFCRNSKEAVLYWLLSASWYSTGRRALYSLCTQSANQYALNLLKLSILDVPGCVYSSSGVRLLY